MKILNTLLLATLMSTSLFASDVYLSDNGTLADIKMPKNGLSFKAIEGYQNYQVIATHFRKDKNELRYILANPIAYNALRAKLNPMPEGSKIVKIGWSVKPMTQWKDALEADEIQRVEYMIKDSKNFNHNGDNWGYARYIKKNGTYKAWDKGVESCIGCHSVVKNDDFLFTSFQKRF